MSTQAASKKATQTSQKSGTSQEETIDTAEISTILNNLDLELQENFGVVTTKKVKQQPKRDVRLTDAKRSVLQSMTIVNEDVRRQINTTVKSQREVRAEIRGTAEKQFTALTAKIQKSQNVVRGDIRNLAGQMKDSFNALKKQMDGMQKYLQKMDAANQQRFLALQRDMLAINQQMASNHKQICDLVNQRARETQAAIIQQIDARIQEQKQLQLQLAARLEGQMATQLKGLEASLQGQIQQQGQQIQQQIQGVEQKVDAIAAQLGALGKELEERAKALAQQGEKLVTIYTCKICGGDVHNAGCASTSDPSSRISFKIKLSELNRLKQMGNVSDSDTTDVGGGEIGYRINIGQSYPDAEALRSALRGAGVNI